LPVLSLDGTNAMREPYWKRRELLESVELAGPHWSVTSSFSDGAALWKVFEEQELEGLVATPAPTSPVNADGSRSRTAPTGSTRT
jgi:ATP-dependent DNA ligase